MPKTILNTDKTSTNHEHLQASGRVSFAGPLAKIARFEKSPEAGCKRGVGLNTLILSDLAKLAHLRRGLGPWDDARADAVFDDAAPRIVAGARASRKLAERELVAWARRHLPEVIEGWGEEWVADRCREVEAERHGSFRTVDEIAKRHGISQDEVLGACLVSLVAQDRPKAVRKADRMKVDALYQRSKRAQEPGYTARENSLAARHRRGEFGSDSLKTVRRKIKAGLIDPEPQGQPEARVLDSGDVHFSSATARSACKVNDEMGTPVSASTATSIEATSAESETHGQTAASAVEIRTFREVLADLKAGADAAWADFISDDPFYRGIDRAEAEDAALATRLALAA
ncbi:hypothetical protein [Methylobacterium oxalidis]|uniref:Uncharacterized protein n=1 Tax=Methylobacterium oxalidis TaxID=944322 RepID=A0A512J188_9HYPH|nr:hypothetical protein [Methylobacterium oxalidis]GEP03697.1 hypothetical protein MOX02_17350 [Methylobacterium oxalidis]GJE33697.1 hypothetical protein LDDCCGHA_3900 [Methylobacterium oxalidis]GLS62281.1 hypothetical protein GCM10007888_06620 [Methylobacterium oxalidis]